MKLKATADTYVVYKQSLGMDFRTAAKTLRAFCRVIGDVELQEIEPDAVLDFLKGSGLTRYWHNKLGVLRGFYRFVISRGYVSVSPLPTVIPKQPRIFSPYIYSEDEIRRLLTSAPLVCKHPRCDVQGNTFQTLLFLVWGTGLRISEALRLRLRDVDLAHDLLTIHDTKFFKSRLVPMDPRLTSNLSAYAALRRKLPRLDGEDSVFFVSRQGKCLGRDYVESYFRKLCELVGVKREDGSRYQPRLHDLRHGFASSRILQWYRLGANVQRLLPHLSTYLGHVNLSDTQRYLTATAEVLQEASARFERYAMEVNDG